MAFIFVALNCEAKPLIQAWRLKSQPQKQPFAIYRNNDIVVVISGVGKIAMAGAVAYTMAQFPDIAQPILLNFGIAGHGQQALGSCFLADKITDADAQRCFYPQIPFHAPCRTLPLITLSRADADYADDNLRDMEASAFYEIAVKFSSSELIHCLKVVSDNAESAIENINEDMVAAWVQACLASVDDVISALATLRRALPVIESELYRQLLGQFHFTATNAAKLRALLNRWQVLNRDETFHLSETNAGNARELLVWLERQLEEKRYYL
jgi:adenosylhomocysteine nucleosidase